MGLGRGRDAQHRARRSGMSESSQKSLTDGPRGPGRTVYLHFADIHLDGDKGGLFLRRAHTRRLVASSVYKGFGIALHGNRLPV